MFVVLAEDAPQTGDIWWGIHQGRPSGSNTNRIICAAMTYFAMKEGGEVISRHRSRAVAEKAAKKVGGSVLEQFELSAGASGYAYELIADSLMHLPNYISTKGSPANQAMQDGIRMEPSSRRWLSLELGLDVTEVSCCLTDDLAWVCSPDGMLGLQHDPEPAGHFNFGEKPVPYYRATAEEAIELKNVELKKHLAWLDRGTLPLEHKQQCHAYFPICGVKQVRFLSYSESAAPLHVLIEPDAYTAAVAQAQHDFTQQLREARAKFLPQGAL